MSDSRYRSLSLTADVLADVTAIADQAMVALLEGGPRPNVIEATRAIRRAHASLTAGLIEPLGAADASTSYHFDAFGEAGLRFCNCGRDWPCPMLAILA